LYAAHKTGLDFFLRAHEGLKGSRATTDVGAVAKEHIDAATRSDVFPAVSERPVQEIDSDRRTGGVSDEQFVDPQATTSAAEAFDD
jgi:hypothetical protein